MVKVILPPLIYQEVKAEANILLRWPPPQVLRRNSINIIWVKENFPGSHIIHFLLAVVILYFNWQLQTISLMIDIFSTDLLSKLAKKNNDSSAFWCRSGVVSIWSMKYWWCCVYISVYFAKNNVHKEYGRKWGKKRGRFEIGNSACMCRM